MALSSRKQENKNLTLPEFVHEKTKICFFMLLSLTDRHRQREREQPKQVVCKNWILSQLIPTNQPPYRDFHMRFKIISSSLYIYWQDLSYKNIIDCFLNKKKRLITSQTKNTTLIIVKNRSRWRLLRRMKITWSKNGSNQDQNNNRRGSSHSNHGSKNRWSFFFVLYRNRDTGRLYDTHMYL